MAGRLAIKKDPAGRFSLVLSARGRAVAGAKADTLTDADRDGTGSASTHALTATVVDGPVAA